MSDSVIIALIVVIGIVLVFYKDKITGLFFKANKESVEGGIKADKSKGIIGNMLLGVKNKLKITDKTNAQDNKLAGKENEIEIQSNSQPKKFTTKRVPKNKK
jgi:hypothetical protein